MDALRSFVRESVWTLLGATVDEDWSELEAAHARARARLGGRVYDHYAPRATARVVWERARELGGAHRRASVLPVMVAPDHDVYWLLGREVFDKRWPEGSGRWADFGGHAERGEPPARTAAREFCEETEGRVRAFEDSETNVDALALTLEHGLHVARVSYERPARAGAAVDVMFVVRVPWQPELHRARLRGEKVELRLWSLEHVREALAAGSVVSFEGRAESLLPAFAAAAELALALPERGALR